MESSFADVRNKVMISAAFVSKNSTQIHLSYVTRNQPLHTLDRIKEVQSIGVRQIHEVSVRLALHR